MDLIGLLHNKSKLWKYNIKYENIYNLNRGINDEDIIEICDLIKKYRCDKLKEIE